jgi:hypothetical protein
MFVLKERETKDVVGSEWKRRFSVGPFSAGLF